MISLVRVSIFLSNVSHKITESNWDCITTCSDCENKTYWRSTMVLYVCWFGWEMWQKLFYSIYLSKHKRSVLHYGSGYAKNKHSGCCFWDLNSELKKPFTNLNNKSLLKVNFVAFLRAVNHISQSFWADGSLLGYIQGLQTLRTRPNHCQVCRGWCWARRGKSSCAHVASRIHILFLSLLECLLCSWHFLRALTGPLLIIMKLWVTGSLPCDKIKSM